jgi:hypothetical protein
VSKIERTALCVYGHFSQPARGNPMTYEIGSESEAAPYLNWNDRINQNCYFPNATSGNFNRISYSVSEGLMKWLESNAPETYQLIIKGDGPPTEDAAPRMNALATAHNHVILPLARKRDKRTQIIWGMAAFERHFGRKPLGFWLPEMAVDLETLSFLADAGIQYTVLSGKQIVGHNPQAGAGPYRVALSGGRSIGVFVRHDELSSQLSFNVHNLGGAGFWAREVLSPARKNVSSLLLLATAGETFGHHFAGEEQFLYWLVNHEAQHAGYQIVSLDQYFQMHPPVTTVQIEERTSWSSLPGLTQWATGTADSQKDTTWKGALRRALDNAASDLDKVYEDLVRSYPIDPWDLRNQYLGAIFAGKTGAEFISEHVPDMPAKQQQQVATLLQAQRLTQRMYNSYTWTEDRLDSRQPAYAIACAAAALSMAQEATGHDLNDRLPMDLAVVTSPETKKTGDTLLKEAIKQFDLTLMRG